MNRSKTQSCNELQDRLYRSKDGHAIAQIFGSPPAFPFNQSDVGVAVVKSAATQHVANGNYHNNHQSYNQQSYSNQQTSNYEQSNGYQTSQEQEVSFKICK